VVKRRKFKGAKGVVEHQAWHDEGFDRLTSKLYKWLINQPEWVAVLGAPRNVRKEYARRIGDAVAKVPEYISAPPPEAPRLNIRVGTGAKEAQVDGSVQGRLEDDPGPTLPVEEEYDIGGEG
jgi:hypothetical protein